MEKMRRGQPLLFLLLLPLSFAAQSLSEHFGRASLTNALLVALGCAGGLAILFFALRISLEVIVAGISTTVAGWLFLYWSYPYLRLKEAGSGLSLKGILIGALLLWALLTWGASHLSEKGKNKTVQFLNALFGLLFLVNSGLCVAHMLEAKKLVQGRIVAAVGNGSLHSFYILLFDEAGSTESLRRMGVEDYGLDSFLAQTGFRHLKQSRSNYSFTHFSLASLLNEDYLSLPPNHIITQQDYNKALLAINHSSVVKSFAESGYAIHNYSLFEVNGIPPFEGKSPLLNGSESLLAGTLWARVLRPYWHKKTGLDSVQWFGGLRRNEALLAAIKTDAAGPRPVFCYAHFLLPHTPFYYDAAGKKLSFAQSLQRSATNDIDGYRANWKAAVGRMKTAVFSIQSQDPQAIIFLLGDHGFRREGAPGADSTDFQNLGAVYNPGHSYNGFSDTTTLVNAMRLLHNYALHTALPLLPNKTVPLHDYTKLDW